MSPETGLSIGPQFDRGGRFRGDLESPTLPSPIDSNRVARGAGREKSHEISSFVRLPYERIAYLCAGFQSNNW